MSRMAASAPVFAALGDPQRMVLVSRLCQRGPLSVTHLTAGTSITRQGVTKHLRVLEAAGIARSQKLGREKAQILSAVHDFRPRLPWWLYKLTQLQIHALVMWAFGRHLARIAARSCASGLPAPH